MYVCIRNHVKEKRQQQRAIKKIVRIANFWLISRTQSRKATREREREKITPKSSYIHIKGIRETAQSKH